MAFTAKDVQALREASGAGMMDCKKALTETDGNMEKAMELLRERGIAAAAKKADRIAAEGACYAVVDESGAASIVEINSETDFSAKSDAFQTFLKDVATVVCQTNPSNVEDLKAKPYLSSGRTVGEMLQDKVLTIGENIQIRRIGYYADPCNAAYVHMGGKIAVLVHLEVDDKTRSNPAVTELGRDLAMQVAAMRPLCLDRTQLDPAELEKEREILVAQVKQDEKNANKPQQVIDKIVEGRIGKYYSEVCLLDQPFVKENKLTVEAYVAQKAKELGGTIRIAEYTRYETGEGLAKREDDFAAEVAKMTGK